MHTGDYISKKLFIEYDFDFFLIKKTLKLQNKNHKRETIINIGANIGSICIRSIKENFFKYGIFFEPSIINYRLLMANIHINKLEDKIKAYRLALSDRKKILKLIIDTKGNLGRNRISKKKNQKNLKIEKVKSDILDNFTSNLSKNNTLIFMDVQGHETNVFKGAKKTIKKKIPIVFEFSPLLLDKNWIRNFDLLLKNYNFFYNLREKKRKEKFNKDNLVALFNKLKLQERTFAELMIF